MLRAAHLDFAASGFVVVRGVGGRGLWASGIDRGLGASKAVDFVWCDRSGALVEGSDRPTDEVELAVEILDARPEAVAVVHAHSLHATAFSSSTTGLHALSHEGCHLAPSQIPRWRSGDQRSVSSALGQRNAMLLAQHGQITVGATLGEAVAMAVYLERACQLQLMVGEDPYAVPDELVEEKRLGQLARPRTSWEYLSRQCARAAAGRA